MEDVRIIIFGVASIIGCYTAMIVHIKHTNSQLSKVYELINQHINDKTIHPVESNLVQKDICGIVRNNYESTVKEIKETMKSQTQILTEIRDRLSHLESRGD